MRSTVLLTGKEQETDQIYAKQTGLFNDYYRFIYFILMSFVTGTLLLVGIQYNSSKNMDRLISGNDRLLKELKVSNHIREIERDIIGVESRIRAAIATGDTSHLQGIDSEIWQVEMFLDSLKAGTSDKHSIGDIERLKYLAHQKLFAKKQLLILFYRTGKLNDIALISNPRARVVSNEISTSIRNIYEKRQQIMVGLSDQIEANGRKARFYEIILAMLILLSGAGLGWFIINRIKKQNQLILKLDVSEKKTREAAVVKENFMANMSHEIRTPLNSILGFTNLLLKRDIEAEQKEFVEAIQRSGENLLSIVNDILDLSKIEAGMMRIVSTPFSIRGLVQSIESLFFEKVKGKRLILEWSVDAAIPDTLVGDSTRLTQILVNLIGNALKFTEKGKICVSVYSNQIEDRQLLLGFRITDTGIGISDEKIPHIFDRFRQAEDSITRNYGGTGLGLSIVRDLIRLQDGQIAVESEIGKGTVFNFFIPYLISTEQITSRYVAPSFQRVQPPECPLHMLVVDDNEMNQSLMKYLLSQWNFSFDIASGGLQAIEFLKKEEYDLVLMDIQMPGMDGYAVTHYIRAVLRFTVPVIAMTAHAMAGEREKCLSNGMNEYLSKPINENDLLRMIRKFSPSDIGGAKVENVQQSHGFKFIDLNYMKAISKGNIAYEKKATGQFIRLIPCSITTLQNAHQSHDFPVLNHVAHDMKTTVSILGLTAILDEPLDYIENVTGPENVLNEKIEFVIDTCEAAVREAELFLATLP
jgi:signal transduction histidine kinase/CheY-like chemotaxis protein